MPVYEMTVDVPEYPKGHRIETSYGVFENGETKEVEMSTEDADKIRDGDAHGVSIKVESRRKTTADRRAEEEASVSGIEDATRNEGGEQ